LTLTSLSSERDRLHVSTSLLINQDLNTNFLKKKLSRFEKKKKYLNSNVSRTTEVNDARDVDGMPEEGIVNNMQDTNQKNNQGNTNNLNTNNLPNGIREKHSNKNLKEKQRNEGNRQERPDNQNKNKVKQENPQSKQQNLNQPKTKQQHQQQSKQNVNAHNSSDDERKLNIIIIIDDDEDFRNDERANRNVNTREADDNRHKPSIESDTDSVDAQDDLKFLKKPTPVNSSKNR
jgi:hypothetical protein